MKRLSPNTGLPFKYGETREDGRFFVGYLTKRLNKNGFYREQWSLNRPHQKDTKNRKLRKQKVSGRTTELLAGAKSRAKRKNITFELDRNWIEDKLKIGTCELTGLKFDFSLPTQKRSNPFAPSLDRIDSLKGYTKENTRLVLNSVNMALNEFGLEHLILISKAIVLNN